MTRIFYSDYGEDPVRIAKIERIITALQAQGATVCRSNRRAMVSAGITLPMPPLVMASPSKLGIDLKSKVKATDPLLRQCAEIFRYDHSNRSERDCYVSMHLYQQYITSELERFAPDLVLLWHQFNAYHYIIEDWCQARNIPVLYGEHGVLPGSWCFEFGGQMAESWIGRDPAGFQALPVEPGDLDRAQRYLAHAVENRMNRKAPGLTAAETGLADRLRADPRPKILYAGVNDYKAGLQPFDQTRTLRHTGDFISTPAGLEALLPLARKNNWHVLYKPHPSIKHELGALSAHQDYLSVIDKRVDLIDLLQYCDVLATIVSQSAYMALMHDTPVVLMGRMQLSGSGLVQEALYRRDLTTAVKSALADSDHETRRARLVDHVARLMRYYVIADDFDAHGLFCYDLADFAQSLLQLAADNAKETA